MACAWWFQASLLQRIENWEDVPLEFLGSPSILSKVLYSGVLLNHSDSVPMQCLIGCSRVSYKDTIQNLIIRRLVRKTLMTCCDSLLQFDTNRSRLTTMCVDYQNN